jgi:predicted branched-subunit amino acid permease
MTLKTDLTDPEVIGNYIEGVFWTTVGIVLGIAGLKTNPAFKSLSLIACAVFIIFGVSDLVEAQTGAWWRPLWLLAWKGLCLVGLTWCYWKYRQIKARLAILADKPRDQTTPSESLAKLKEE